MFNKVSEYTRSSLVEVKELPCDEFMLYFRCAIIDDLIKSEEGREILQDWKRDTVNEEEDGVSELTSLLGEEVEHG